MGKKNGGNLRKLSDLIFKRITKKEAKKRINDEFKRYKEKKEIEIGEKFSKEETKELRKDFFETRGREIIQEEARKARVKATVLAFAATLGIGAVGGYELGTHNSEIPGITDGRESIEINMNEVEKDVDVKNVRKQEDKDKHDIFVKEIQDGALSEKVESTDEKEQEPTLEEKIAEEIEGLNSVEEIDRYLANIYIDVYEQKTGDRDLNTSDIQISQKYESYIYVLEDGQLVSHGELPYETEKQIEADGKQISESRVNQHDFSNGLKIYSVKLAESGKTIDEMSTEFERIIPGENYTEMKDYESVLCDIADVTEKIFELKHLFQELENDPNNEYIGNIYKNTEEELTKAVAKLYEEKDTQAIEESQMQATENDER